MPAERARREREQVAERVVFAILYLQWIGIGRKCMHEWREYIAGIANGPTNGRLDGRTFRSDAFKVHFQSSSSAQKQKNIRRRKKRSSQRTNEVHFCESRAKQKKTFFRLLVCVIRGCFGYCTYVCLCGFAVDLFNEVPRTYDCYCDSRKKADKSCSKKATTNGREKKLHLPPKAKCKFDKTDAQTDRPWPRPTAHVYQSRFLMTIFRRRQNCTVHISLFCVRLNKMKGRPSEKIYDVVLRPNEKSKKKDFLRLVIITSTHCTCMIDR